MENLEYIKLFVDLLIVPIFAMVWGVQGRISRMEGELKALYHLITILTGRKREND